MLSSVGPALELRRLRQPTAFETETETETGVDCLETATDLASVVALSPQAARSLGRAVRQNVPCSPAAQALQQASQALLFHGLGRVFYCCAARCLVITPRASLDYRKSSVNGNSLDA